MKRCASKPFASIKCIRPDARHTVSERCICQLVALSERAISDVGDAARNRHARKEISWGANWVATADCYKRERVRPDAGDGKAVDVGWNGHCTAKPPVSGDGDAVRVATI